MAGRPLLPIDPEEVVKLAALGCTNQEIADFFGCGISTIETRFQGDTDKGRSTLKMDLRTMQLKAARRGNVAMLIWLGKQFLGQSERAILDISKIPDDMFLMEGERRLEARKKLKDADRGETIDSGQRLLSGSESTNNSDSGSIVS